MSQEDQYPKEKHSQEEQKPIISTSGGAAVSGSVSVGRDFIGRDKIEIIIQQALSASEEAARARDLELQELAKGVSTYASNLAKLAGTTTSSEPFRGLLEYRIGDVEQFYGRNGEIDELLGKLKKRNLTILHAESGAGKTSLLQAGITLRLVAEGHIPIYLRPYDQNPALVVKKNFTPDIEQFPGLSQSSLVSCLHKVCSILGEQVSLYMLMIIYMLVTQ